MFYVRTFPGNRIVEGKTLNELIGISEEIRSRLQAYAEKHNITLEEAKKRARIRIGDREYPLFEESGDVDE